MRKIWNDLVSIFNKIFKKKKKEDPVSFVFPMECSDISFSSPFGTIEEIQERISRDMETIVDTWNRFGIAVSDVTVIFQNYTESMKKGESDEYSDDEDAIDE